MITVVYFHGITTPSEAEIDGNGGLSTSSESIGGEPARHGGGGVGVVAGPNQTEVRPRFRRSRTSTVTRGRVKIQTERPYVSISKSSVQFGSKLRFQVQSKPVIK